MIRPPILLLMCAIVFAAAMVANGPAIFAEGQSFDDVEYLHNNPLVRNPSWPSAWKYISEVWKPTIVHGYYRPVTMLSFIPDALMGGTPNHLRPFHFTSLIFHGLSSILLFLLLWQLFRSAWPACFAACLFAVHPLNSEAVAWVAERKTVLASFFALGALNLHVANARNPQKRYYVGAILLYILATLSKPTTLPLPLLMLVLDFWPLRRLSFRRSLNLAPFFLIALGMAILITVSQARAGGAQVPPGRTIPEALLIICHNIAFYLHKTIWPPAVAGFYRAPPLTWHDETIRNSVIASTAVILIALISLRWTRAIFAGFAFFFFAALPTMNILRFTDISPTNRFAYLPSFGGYLILCALLIRLWPNEPTSKSRRSAIIVPILLFATFEIALTHRYLGHWRNTETLFRHMVAAAPGEAKVQAGLGEFLTRRSRFAEAIPHFEKAVAADPNYPETYNSYTEALIGLGRLDEARRILSIALSAKPDDAAAQTNLGILLAAQNRISEAIAVYQKAVELDPGYAYSRTCWGMALAGMGRFGDAIEKYKEALRIDPEQPAAHDNLGVALAALDRVDEAIPHFREALRLLPEYDAARKHLEKALASKKPPREKS